MSASDLVAAARHCVEAQRSAALCTVVRGPDLVGTKRLVDPDGETTGSTGNPELDAAIDAAAPAQLRSGLSRTLQVVPWEVLFDVIKPDPRLIIVGAVHIAVALCEYASNAGFAVTVVDPRPQLNSPERFGAAQRLLVGWPEDELPGLRFDENTYVAVLTHDEKFDDPTIDYVLRTPARYIGAIGSKRTQALRRERLASVGFTQETIDRLQAPIGLDIGAETPEEIAIAILAEMIMVKYGHRGMSLSLHEAPHIHA